MRSAQPPGSTFGGKLRKYSGAQWILAARRAALSYAACAAHDQHARLLQAATATPAHDSQEGPRRCRAVPLRAAGRGEVVDDRRAVRNGAVAPPAAGGHDRADAAR